MNTADIILLLAACIVFSLFSITGAIQCYSCQGAGPSEIEANIRCLETAYLENCDDFYEYYSDVEETTPSDEESYEEYYYYDEEYEEEEDDDKESNSNKRESITNSRGRSNEAQQNGRSRGKRSKRAARNNRKGDKIDNRDGPDFDISNDKPIISNTTDQQEFDYTAFENKEYDYGEDFRFPKPVEDSKQSRRPVEGQNALTKRKLPRKPSSKEVDDYEEEYRNTAEEEEDEQHVEPDRLKVTLPKDPEHWCYSQTKKNAWESYKVEKGCKKISYCQEHVTNFPEWSLPWNFCCDKSRCNAKLVKDMPQRIHGMGCRRTDDCIQGHVNRPVCPGMFQSCPKISRSLIKMECRITSPGFGGRKHVATYFDKFKEKKCYCTNGYFPRGPICSSDGSSIEGLAFGPITSLLLLRMILQRTNDF